MKGMLAAIAFLCAATAAVAETSCTLTAADKEANAKLGFDDFDQNPTLPSSARALMQRGCNAEVVEAEEDYMLHHQPLSDGQRAILLFHEAQSLAVMGREREAARLMAATKDLKQKPDDDFDWNTYVEGTWAFLVKDRKRLELASARLSQHGNAINAKMLRGLLTCFNRPYSDAYGNPDCSKP